MSVNTSLIYRCLSSASAVIRSWFIYELQKSTTIALSRNSLYTFYSRNPTCGIYPCLRICNRKYTPPCPQNFIIVNPPCPSEILTAVRGTVWIFSGIAHCYNRHQHHSSLSLSWLSSSSLLLLYFTMMNNNKKSVSKVILTLLEGTMFLETQHNPLEIASINDSYFLQADPCGRSHSYQESG